jgi:type VII secretion integral membrane protein EccD
VSIAYSRVTVVTGSRRVDLALPSALPLSDVLPQLLGYCAPSTGPDQPAGWTLARVGGHPLRLADTLAQADVHDGEILELRTSPDPVRPARVEDVRDAVEDAVDGAARPWQPATTVSFALASGSVGLALAALLPAAREPGAAGAVAAAALAAGLLVGAGWWAGRAGRPRVAALAIAAATLWGGVGGWLMATFPGWPAAAAGGAALAGAGLVAALARILTPAATAHLAGLSLLAAAGVGAGAATLAGADPLAGVRVATAGAVLLVGVLPRLALSAGGLAGADYRVRRHGLLAGEELARRIAQSHTLLFGGVLGTAVLAAAGGGLLAASGSVWDRLLAAAVGLALVLRSRVFSQVPQIVPLRAAGLLLLGLSGGLVVQEVAARHPAAVGLPAVVMAGAVAACLVPRTEIARARLRQLLDRAEPVAVAAMVGLAAAALGGLGAVPALPPG